MKGAGGPSQGVVTRNSSPIKSAAVTASAALNTPRRKTYLGKADIAASTIKASRNLMQSSQSDSIKSSDDTPAQRKLKRKPDQSPVAAAAAAAVVEESKATAANTPDAPDKRSKKSTLAPAAHSKQPAVSTPIKSSSTKDTGPSKAAFKSTKPPRKSSKLQLSSESSGSDSDETDSDGDAVLTASTLKSIAGLRKTSTGAAPAGKKTGTPSKAVSTTRALTSKPVKTPVRSAEKQDADTSASKTVAQNRVADQGTALPATAASSSRKVVKSAVTTRRSARISSTQAEHGKEDDGAGDTSDDMLCSEEELSAQSATDDDDDGEVKADGQKARSVPDTAASTLQHSVKAISTPATPAAIAADVGPPDKAPAAVVQGSVSSGTVATTPVAATAAGTPHTGTDASPESSWDDGAPSAEDLSTMKISMLMRLLAKHGVTVSARSHAPSGSARNQSIEHFVACMH